LIDKYKISFDQLFSTVRLDVRETKARNCSPNDMLTVTLPHKTCLAAPQNLFAVPPSRACTLSDVDESGNKTRPNETGIGNGRTWGKYFLKLFGIHIPYALKKKCSEYAFKCFTTIVLPECSEILEYFLLFFTSFQ